MTLDGLSPMAGTRSAFEAYGLEGAPGDSGLLQGHGGGGGSQVRSPAAPRPCH